MAKQMRALFYGLIGVVAILAASTTFFAAKSFNLGEKEKSGGANQAATSSSTQAPEETPSPETTSEVTQATSSSERPSHPTDTYTIQQSETLFSIAQKQEVTLTELSDANGITDANKIQAGQVLVIPKNGQVSFTIDNSKATALQDQVNSGRLKWRLSPEDTARADSPTVYGLEVTDGFVLKGRDDNAGTAEVSATRESRRILIKLSQPVTKGEKGMWAIESIKEE